MSTLTKKLKDINSTLKEHLGKAATLHPVLFFALSSVGMPLITLAGVFACTVAVAYPFALIFGWL